jgi:hypothetical protein
MISFSYCSLAKKSASVFLSVAIILTSSTFSFPKKSIASDPDATSVLGGITDFSDTWNQFDDANLQIIEAAYIGEIVPIGVDTVDADPISFSYEIYDYDGLHSSIDQEQANKLIEIQNSTSLTNEEVLTALESGQTVGHESEKYRAENATLIQMEDSRNILVASMSPQYFLDEGGQYRPIEQAFESISDVIVVEDYLISKPEHGHKILMPDSAPLGIEYYDYGYLKTDAKTLVNTSLPDNSYAMTMVNSSGWIHLLPIGTATEDSAGTESGQAPFGDSEPVVVEGSLAFSDVSTDIDETFQPLGDGILHTFALQQVPQNLTTDGSFILKSKVQLPEGAVLKANGVDIGDNFSTMEESIGVFVNDEKIFEFPHPVAYDAGNAYSWEFEFPLETEWVKNGQTYEVSTKIPSNWLTATEREYPVEVNSFLISESNTIDGGISTLSKTVSEYAKCRYMMLDDDKTIDPSHKDYANRTAVGKKSNQLLRPVYYLDFDEKLAVLNGKDIDSATLGLWYDGSTKPFTDFRDIDAYSIESSIDCDEKQDYSEISKGNSVLHTLPIGGTTSHLYSFEFKSRVQQHADGVAFYGLFLEGNNFQVGEKKYFMNTSKNTPKYTIQYTTPQETNVKPSRAVITPSSTTFPKNNSVTISVWSTDNNENDVLDYEIDWGDGSSKSYIHNKPQGATATATKNGGYSNRGSYTIRVNAIDQDGAESGWSTKSIRIENTEPNAGTVYDPSNYQTNVSAPQHTIRWNSGSDDNGDSLTYRIYLSTTNSRSSAALKYSGSGTSYTINNLGYSTQYYLWLETDDNDGGMTVDNITFTTEPAPTAITFDDINPKEITKGGTENFVITGNNLDSVERVLIYGIREFRSSNFSNRTSTSLTINNVAIPEGWNTGQKSITLYSNSAANTDSKNFYFTVYEALKKPVISSISPSNVFRTTGVELEIFGSNFNGANAVQVKEYGTSTEYDKTYTGNELNVEPGGTKIIIPNFTLNDDSGSYEFYVKNPSTDTDKNISDAFIKYMYTSNLTTPDLYVSYAKATTTCKINGDDDPTNYRDQDTMTVRFSIANRGTDAQNESTATVRFCDNKTCSGSSNIIITKSVPSLISQDKYNSEFITYTNHPSWFNEGDLAYVVIEADSNNTINEGAHEDKNSKAVPIRNNPEEEVSDPNFNCGDTSASGFFIQSIDPNWTAPDPATETYADLSLEIFSFLQSVKKGDISAFEIPVVAGRMHERLVNWIGIQGAEDITALEEALFPAESTLLAL